MLRNFISKLLEKQVGRRYSRTADLRKTETNTYLHATTARDGNWAFTLKTVNTLIKTKALASIGFLSRPIINTPPTRVVLGKTTVNVEESLEYMSWICSWSRGREVAHGHLRSSPKPEKRYIICRACHGPTLVVRARAGVGRAGHFGPSRRIIL